ncbi:MAG: type III toxin-antitoxin system ToxN/AbiQ family toxin [Peptococcaceae bacterium]|nr:type III toxin-antitoxin system ToxN/AbiQ family toxin [Peptococcaceae bacterium]
MGYILALKLYVVDEAYIEYLWKFEHKVMFNKNQKRPYVGVVYTVNDLNYFVPLTSPKQKHETMDKDIDFRKIARGKYGALNFGNMIPVPAECLQQIDFSKLHGTYKDWILNQYRELKKERETLRETAEKLYAVYMKPVDELTPHEQAVKERCCDFVLLEKLCKEYQAD